MFNCTAASRKECENTKESHWARNLVSCVAKQLQENLLGPLNAEWCVYQTLVLSNFEGKEVVQEMDLMHLGV